MQKEEETIALIEASRVELNSYIKRQSKVILELNQKLSCCQHVYDCLVDRIRRLDNRWNEIQNTSTAKTLVLGMINTSVLCPCVSSQDRKSVV